VHEPRVRLDRRGRTDRRGRGLTFIDLLGLRELVKQNEYARANRHNLAVVRGTDAINRLLKLTDVEGLLVLVDDPEDLVPPPLTH
jgi:anti-anti-sigma regulatory factor